MSQDWSSMHAIGGKISSLEYKSNPCNSYFKNLPRDIVETVLKCCSVTDCFVFLSAYRFDRSTQFLKNGAWHVIESCKDGTEILDVYSRRMPTIPSAIFTCTRLTKLSLIACRIFRVSEEIGSLVNLTELNLSNNDILRIPEEIGQLQKLTLLNISYNRIKELPEEIGNLSELEYFFLHNNGGNMGVLPQILNKFTKMRILQLNGNNLRMPIFMFEIHGIWIIDYHEEYSVYSKPLNRR